MEVILGTTTLQLFTAIGESKDWRPPIHLQLIHEHVETMSVRGFVKSKVLLVIPLNHVYFLSFVSSVNKRRQPFLVLHNQL